MSRTAPRPGVVRLEEQRDGMMTIPQIAEVMGCSKQGVWYLLRSGLRKLRRDQEVYRRFRDLVEHRRALHDARLHSERRSA